MSETPSERQTGISKDGGEQVGSVEANSPSPGGRSLQAGGEFLKALAGDLAAAASRLRLLLTAKPRRTRPSRASAPSRTSQGSIIGRVLWRLSIALLWFASICAGALAAFTLWVIFGFPPEPQKSDANTLGSQFEARRGESLGGGGPLNVTGAARPDLGREPGAQSRPEAAVTRPSIVFSGASPPAQSDHKGGASADRSSRAESGSSSPTAAESKKATKEAQTEMGAGADKPQLVRTEPQDRRPAASQQEISTTDLRPRAQCSVDLCGTTYKSFHAADCTYQPNGGGPRRLCELRPRSAEAVPQTSRAATDPGSEAKHTGVAERAEEAPKSATPARAGAQCKVDLCASTYASFHAADCTYQPYDGGPRRICER
jgi:hypothetical protein